MIKRLFQELSFHTFLKHFENLCLAQPGSEESLLAMNKAYALFYQEGKLPERIHRDYHDYYHGVLLCTGAHNGLATCQNLEEQADAACQYELGLSHLEKTQFKPAWANMAVNLADFYRTCSTEIYSKRVERSRSLYEQTYAYFDETKDRKSQWHAFEGLQEIYFDRAPTSDPMAFERGIGICQDLLKYDFIADNDEKLANVLFALGEAYRCRMYGKSEKNQLIASEVLRTAKQFAKLETDLRLWCSIRISLADILISRPDLQEPTTGNESAQILSEIISLPEASLHSDQFVSANTLLFKCNSLRLEVSALSSLEDFGGICSKIEEENDNFLSVAAYFRWGETCLTCYERYGNSQFLKQAETALDLAISFAEPEHQRENYLRILGYQAVTYECQERWADAYDIFVKIFSFLDEKEKETNQYIITKQTTHNFRNIFLGAPFVAAAVGEIENAMRWYEHLNARNMKETLKSNDFAVQNGSARLNQIKVLGEGAIDYASGEDRHKLIDILTSLNRHTPSKPIDTHEPLNLDATLQRLNAWIALPLLNRTHSRIVLLPPKSDTSLAILSPINKLGKRDFASFYSAHEKSGNSSYGQAFVQFEETGDLQSFASSILKPLEFVDELFGKWLWNEFQNRTVPETERLILISNSLLNMFPVTMAGSTTNEGKSLASNIAVSVSPSVVVSAQIKSRSTQDDEELNANPSNLAFIPGQYGDDLPTLELEQEILSSAFDMSKENEIKNDNVKQLVLNNLKNKSHWHFATHGVFNTRNPMHSTLALLDGSKLSLYELAGSETNDSLRLVTLSSCFVGGFDILDKFSEFAGFPSAFMQLGARGVIANIWPASDQASTLLMSRFYDEHIGNNKEPAVALSQAQKWLSSSTAKEIMSYLEEKVALGHTSRNSAIETLKALDDGRQSDRPFEHPFFWGGFVLYGE